MRSFSCCLVPILISVSFAKNLPDFIEKCSMKEETQLGVCILDRVKVLMPRLLKGVPELKLPPLEPLTIAKLELHTGTGTNLAFDSTVVDIKCTGLKNLKVTSMDLSFEKKMLHFHLQIPALHVVGDYVLNGKVLLFELSSKGLLTLEINDIEGDATMHFDIKEKNGKKYLTFTDERTLDHKLGKINVHFTDLFKNNAELNEQVNAAINENIVEIGKEINPLVFESIHVLMTGLVEPIFKDYSLDELFVN